MTAKKEKFLWTIYVCVLVLLFLLSSTDLIIKERKEEVYPISVIVEDSSDDNYVNFKKGMDRAALDFNADVSFITLYDKGSQSQQLDLMVREQQDKVKAMIVSPVNDASLLASLAEHGISSPLVLYNTVMTGDSVFSTISPDYSEMGRELALRAIEGQEIKIPVYLFAQGKPSGTTGLFYDGVNAALREQGWEATLFTRQDEETFRKTIEELVYPGSQKVLVIALDQESLLETAAILSDSAVYPGYVGGLYGRGTSVLALNYLDHGIVTGLSVTNDYNAGYLCVKNAVEAIKNRSVQPAVPMESYCIDRKDLRRTEYEKMLYPIE